MSEHVRDGGGVAEVRTVDLTPTWSGIVRGLIAVIENGETFEARRMARYDLIRMAALADEYAAARKAGTL